MKCKYFVPIVLGVVGVAYLIQLASPLRANTDAIRFLEIAASASDGRGFLNQGEPTPYPLGYPLILLALDGAGLACSAILIGLNLVALVVGLASAAYILRKSFQLGTEAIFTIGIMTLLCWVFIKHVTLPLSDLPYFGISLASLAVFTWSVGREPRQKRVGIVLGLVLAGVAISLRSVGIALGPAIVFACRPENAGKRLEAWIGKDRRRGAVILAGVAGAIALGCNLLIRTQYIQEMIRDWCGWNHLTRLRLEDWGELLLNSSQAKLPGPFQELVPAMGGVGGLLLALGAVLRKRVEVIDVYLAGYGAILLVWPYRDARFWIPVFPILVGYYWLVFQWAGRWRVIRWGAPVYLASYSVLGAVALAYSSWISLSGDSFPDRYAGGVYRESYQAAYGIRPQAGRETAGSDPQLVRLLQRYRFQWTPKGAPGEQSPGATRPGIWRRIRATMDPDASHGEWVSMTIAPQFSCPPSG